MWTRACWSPCFTTTATKRSCQPADSRLAIPICLVIERRSPFELAKQLGAAPLLSPGDELLNGSGEDGFVGGLSTLPKGSIEQLLDEGKIHGHG